MMPLETFKRMLAAGRDSALLRYSLGNEYFKVGNFADATVHLIEAMRQDPGHSASWKLLGKALQAAGDEPGALAAYREGIAVAERRGDVQAAKEMAVFARRIEKARATGDAKPPIG